MKQILFWHEKNEQTRILEMSFLFENIIILHINIQYT